MMVRMIIVAAMLFAPLSLVAQSPFEFSVSVARAESSGAPASSSSPCMTTVMLSRSSTPAAFSARSASTMMTSPPFMSMMPGPFAVLASSRSNVWNGLSASKTVSRWPISRTFADLPGWRAIK